MPKLDFELEDFDIDFGEEDLLLSMPAKENIELWKQGRFLKGGAFKAMGESLKRAGATEVPRRGFLKAGRLFKKVETPYGEQFALRKQAFIEPAKGILRGFENIMGSIGAVTRWLGESLEVAPNDRVGPRGEIQKSPEWTKKIIKGMGSKLAEWGGTAHTFWRKEAMRGIEAPDPEIFKGTFMQNPSWIRGVATVTEAIPSLGAATVMSIATQNPLIGAGFLGLLEGSEQYIEAREVGKVVGEAGIIGGLSTVGTSLLEVIPLTRFMRGGVGRLPKDIFVGAIQEGSEEVLQALWQNVIAKYGYDETRDLTEGMVEGFIGGAGSGGIMGGLTSGRGRSMDRGIRNAIEAGVTPDQINGMFEAVKKQIVSKKDDIEGILRIQTDRAKRVLGEEAGFARIGKEPAEVPELLTFRGFEEAIIGKDFIAYTATPEFKKAYRELPRVKEAVAEIVEQARIVKEERQALKDIRKGAIESIRRQKKIDVAIQKINTQTAKLLSREFPEAKVKPLIRRVTKQYIPTEPTIKEPQALRHLFKRQEQVARTTGQAVKKETKERRRLLQAIKRAPISGMAFEDRAEIDLIVQRARKARTFEELNSLHTQAIRIKEQGKRKYLQTKQVKDEQFKADKEILLKTINIQPEKKRPFLRATREPTIREPVKFLKAKTEVARVAPLLPQNIFDLFDGMQNYEGAHHERFYKNVNRAVNEEVRQKLSRYERMQTRMKEIGITEDDLRKSRIVNGEKFTVDEMLTVYTGAKNTEKTLALVHGQRIPYNMMRAVIQQMTQQEKALGEAIIDDYEANYSRLRKSFIEYTDGKEDLGKVTGGYTPIKRTFNGYIPTDQELAKELLERNDLKRAYANRDFTKGRIKIPAKYQQPIKMGEFSTWLEMVEKQEHFISHGNLVKELHRMVQDPDWSEAIRSKYGEAFWKATEAYVNRVANPSIYKSFSQIDKTLSIYRQHAAVAYLGINLVTMLKQAPSMAFFLSDMSVHDLLSGIYDLTTDYKNKMVMIHDLSPQMRMRSLERVLEEMKQKSPNQYNEFVRKIGRLSMVGIREIDKLVTHAGWLGAYNKYTSPPHSLSPQQAADRALALVLRTQPAAHAKDISELYTSERLALLLDFTNQLNKIYNILTYDIPAKAKTGRYKDVLRTGMGVAISAYLISILSMGIIPRRKEEVTQSAIEQFINYIPVFGRGINAMKKGWDFTSIPAFALPEALGRAITQLQRGKLGKTGEALLQAGVVGVGLPYAQPRRLFRAIRKGEPRQLFYGRKRKEIRTGLDVDFDLDFDVDFDVEF